MIHIATDTYVQLHTIEHLYMELLSCLLRALTKTKYTIKMNFWSIFCSSRQRTKSFVIISEPFQLQQLNKYIEKIQNVCGDRIPYWLYLVHVVPLLWDTLHLFLQSPGVFRGVLQVSAGQRHVLQLLLNLTRVWQTHKQRYIINPPVVFGSNLTDLLLSSIITFLFYIRLH